MPNLYIIAGCNGSGKTTASESLLPDLLNCKEFVNADSIAAGLSPYNVEAVAFEAGRIMLQRIRHLISEKQDFAFETTLSSRSYVGIIKEARDHAYEIKSYFLLAAFC
jgi:predicted ABC-type ATPase